MAFMTSCSLRGCCKMMEPVIDPKTKIVYCSECDGELPNISSFTKTQMIATKQVKRGVKSAFGIRCNSCKTEALPKINGTGKLVCSSCSGALNVSAAFEILVKNEIKNGKKDI